MFQVEIWKISEFLSENFQFLVVKFSIHLNRHVFVISAKTVYPVFITVKDQISLYIHTGCSETFLINQDATPTSNCQPITFLDQDCWYKFTYWTANSEDPDHLANWSGCILFAKAGYILAQQDKVNTYLYGHYKHVWRWGRLLLTFSLKYKPLKKHGPLFAHWAKQSVDLGILI